VEFFRKVLIFVFALLSLFFAWVAVLRYFNGDAQDESLQNQTDIHIAQWNPKLEYDMRRGDKLLFFIVDRMMHTPKDPEVKDILNRYYTTVELNPRAFPADFKVLQDIFSMGGGYGDLQAGILTPRMTPILITSNFPKHDTHNMPSLKTALISSLYLYRNNKPEIYATANIMRDRLLMRYRRESRFAPFPLFPKPDGGPGMCREDIDLIAFFRYPNFPAARTALLTENARLAFETAASPACMNNMKEISKFARAELYKRADGLRSPHEKALIMRALAHGYFYEKSEFSKIRIEAIAEDIIASYWDPNRELFLRDRQFPISQNALLISALCYASRATGEKKYIETAKKAALSLKEVAENADLLPSMADEYSQASSEEYAMLMRAFTDMYLCGEGDEFLEAAEALLQKFDRQYGSKDLDFWFDNAYISALSNLVRPVDPEDECMPSSIGTAAQTLCDIAAIRNDPNLIERGKRVFFANLSMRPYSNMVRPSVKLSLFNSPLMQDGLKQREFSANCPPPPPPHDMRR